MSAQGILMIIIGLVVFNFIIESLLELINLRHQPQLLPDELKGISNEYTFSKAQLYHAVNTNFALFRSLITTVVVIAVFYSGMLGEIAMFTSDIDAHKYVQYLIFLAIVFGGSNLFSLPFSLYQTFVIEKKFGFNKTTVPLFISDRIKSFIITAVIGSIILLVFFFALDWLGENFWWIFWLFMSLFMLVATVFFSSWILPLFNKLVPLEEGELKTAITEYTTKVNFPLENIYVMDGSKRSSKSNAFFTGMGRKKKIVLYDTLIKNHTTEELVAILAHEVGHYKKKHILKGYIVSIIQTGVILFVLSRFIFSKELSIALGAKDYFLPLNIISLGVLFSPLSMMIGIVMNAWSRKNEYEADRYASNTYGGVHLAKSLIKLSSDNLVNLTPHPWYVFVHYSHPPIIDRIKLLRKL